MSHISERLRIEREQQFARDVLPWNIAPQKARQAIESVPHWFHTFCLNEEAGIYTPGASGYNSHGAYRTLAIPSSLSGSRVLDIGTYDGFYAFLAEKRGASRVLAIDNETYVQWRAAAGKRVRGGHGIRTIQKLVNSAVQYRKMEVSQLGGLRGREEFDVIFCFGLLHWLVSPLQHLLHLHQLLAPHGTVLLETYGKEGIQPLLRVAPITPREGYSAAFLWEFQSSSLETLCRHAGFTEVELIAARKFGAHPRLYMRLTK